jgi:YD repeat-containing protein
VKNRSSWTKTRFQTETSKANELTALHDKDGWTYFGYDLFSRLTVPTDALGGGLLGLPPRLAARRAGEC